MLSYLETAEGFIQLAQMKFDESYANWEILPNGVQLRMMDIGVLEVRVPDALVSKPANNAIVISCGIHGNETAPIEIVSRQISQIVTGVITPRVNILYLLGNPESMKISKRFVDINMNRLFQQAYLSYERTPENQYELDRAASLEGYVTDFFENNAEGTKTHLDLHTAIKPSFHKTFAIRPFGQGTIADDSKKLLIALGIEAVLQHNKESTTFSYFSSETFKAEAYTLELGKVKPFGENNPEDFKLAIECLDVLIQHQSIADTDTCKLVEYKVVAEIMRNSEDFKFYVDEKVENFTAFPQGYLIAEDFNYNYRVAFEEESVVFPNIQVPVGQRVAVMVTKVNDESKLVRSL